MDRPIHHFSDLLARLSLPSEEQGIAQFIVAHTPLADAVKLPEASLRTPAQATFLRQALLVDLNWAKMIDQLNDALRQSQRK